MSQRSHVYSLAIQTIRGAVGTARDWLRELGTRHGLSEERLYHLDLCANELLANIVEHAYGATIGEIRLELEFDPGMAKLTIVDEGPPFDPLAYPVPPLTDSLAATPIGGRGLFLVRRYADALHYERVDNRNRSTVRIGTPR